MISSWSFGSQARTAPDAGVVVLSVEYGGHVYRWASSPPAWALVGTTEAGAVVPIAFEGAWEPPSILSVTDGVTAEVAFPTELGLAPAEVRGDVLLTGAAAEIAVLGSDDTWNDRVVVVRGFVSSPDIGGPGELVAFTVQPWSRAADRSAVPPVDRAVTLTTWPEPPDDAQGLAYPVVYGRPGEYRDENGDDQRAPACPAIVVETEDVSADVTVASTLVVNWVPALGSTTEVRVWARREDSGYESHVVAVERSTDLRGQQLATVDISGESEAFRSAGEYWVSWSAGGATPLDTQADSDAAATVVEWWLRRSSVPVDWPRTRGALAYVGGLTLSGYVDEAVSPLDWLADRLAAYPVRIVDGPRGVYLAAVRFDAGPRDAVSTVTVADPLEAHGGATGAVRIGRMECDGEGLVNEVWVRWARDIAADAYRRVTVLSIGETYGTEAVLDPEVAGPSRSSRVSEVELPDCWSAATASVIARYVAWREGLPRRTVRVAVPTSTHGHLQVGDVVLFTDDTLGVADVIALVDDVAVTLSPMTEIVLRLVR